MLCRTITTQRTRLCSIPCRVCPAPNRLKRNRLFGGKTQRLALTRTSQARENNVCVSSPPPLGLGENRVFDDDMCTPKTPPHTPGQCGHGLHSGTPPLAQPPQRPPQTRGTQYTVPQHANPTQTAYAHPQRGGADLAFTRYCFMSRLLYTNQYYYLQTAP